MPLLEVIACTVEDAVEAEAGGAGRIELVRELKRGGLTPPIALVQAVLAAVSIPVRVMLRASEDHQLDDEREIGALLENAAKLASLPIDGLVLGFRRGSVPDLSLTARVLAAAPNHAATFHHAFEELSDPIEAIAQLKRLPQIDRILTYGGPGAWTSKTATLQSYVAAAAPEIRILAGGGVDEPAIRLLRRETHVEEFHAGRAARLPATAEGKVSRAHVRNLVDALQLIPPRVPAAPDDDPSAPRYRTATVRGCPWACGPPIKMKTGWVGPVKSVAWTASSTERHGCPAHRNALGGIDRAALRFARVRKARSEWIAVAIAGRS